ncbi:MAG TPA: glycosyltransferase family 2 protein [bacterium]|nr:glycosyltransferase family 2 protein [bacterium]
MKKISVVIPVHNEEENIAPLTAELTAVLAALAVPAEIIFVDDGSTDGTAAAVRTQAGATLVRLRARRGKSAGYRAGFAAATGDVIVTMDGDLQDDPRDLPALLAALESGADLVNGAKTGAHDAGKPLTSRLFNWTVRLTTGLRLRDLNCPFKVYRAELAKTLELHGELFRFIPLLAQLRGFRVAEVPVANRPRRFGRSKFGPGKLLHGLFDLATVLFLYQYNFRPLHLFGSTGLILGTTGFAINLGLTLRYLCNGTIGDHKPLLMGGILLIIVGVQLISTGLLGELIARGQASQRDAEVVEEIRRGLR